MYYNQSNMNYTLVMICFFTAIAFVDIKIYRIPDLLLAAFAIVIIIIEGKLSYMVITDKFIAAAIAFFIFSFVWYFSHSMGFGDVKYAALLGYLLGCEKLVYAFLLTALAGFAVFFLGIMFFRWPKTTKIPFAPFMSAGAIIAINANFNLLGGII